jgi:hypothetical protein
MPIQIVDDNEEFVYEDDDSKIFYRRMPDDVSRRFRARHTKIRGRDRAGNPKEETNLDGLADDLIDYIVIRWENVTHPVTKEEVPCTRENKARLPFDVKNELIQLAQEGSGALAEEKKIESSGSTLTSSSEEISPS